MSAKATFWAWEQSIHHGAKLLLLAIADSANDCGQCWPGYGELRRKTGIKSDATIAKHLKDLEACGLLMIENRYSNVMGEHKQLSNLYHLPLASKYEAVPTSKNEVGPTSKNEVTTSSKNEVTTSSKNEEESNKESNNESKSSKYRKLSLSAIPENIRPDIREFIDHRINLKKPLTQEALSRFMTAASTTADAIGLTTGFVIQETIDAGWQSVKTEWLRNRLGVSHATNRPGSNTGTHQSKLTPSQRTAAKRDALRSQQPNLGAVATDGRNLRPPVGIAARGRAQ